MSVTTVGLDADARLKAVRRDNFTADDLERGSFEISEDGGNKMFEMKEPSRGGLRLNLKAWAKAKLDPAFRDRN